jgi:hypothetical protein
VRMFPIEKIDFSNILAEIKCHTFWAGTKFGKLATGKKSPVLSRRARVHAWVCISQCKQCTIGDKRVHFSECLQFNN